MRLLYADEGLKWRRKWEPVILKWKRQSESWVGFVTVLRENKSDRLMATRNLLNNSSEPELREFLGSIYNNLLALAEMEAFKKILYQKSRDESPLVRDFIDQTLEQFSDYNGKVRKGLNAQSSMLKDALETYIECIETTEPMLDVSGIKMINYEHFRDCVCTLKEIVNCIEIGL